MKIFCSFLILFPVISAAQSNNEMRFDYPDFCPDTADVVIRIDRDGKVDLTEFLDGAKHCLNQSDYEQTHFMENMRWKLSGELCKDQFNLQSCHQNLKSSILGVQIALLEHQQNRILYPDNYTPVGNLRRHDIEQAAEAMRAGKCVCNDRSVAKILIYGSEVQRGKTIDKLRSFGSSCLQDMWSALVDRNMYFNIPNACQYQTENPICDKWNNDTKIIKQRILEFANLIKPETVSSFEVCLDNQKSNSLASISDFLSGLENHLTCSDYSVGEERKISVRYTGRHYSIKRQSNRDYTASVAVRFISSYLDSSQAYDHHIHTHYMKKAQECIKEANTKMLGPNGEKLEIVFKDANEASSCEYQHNIHIFNPGTELYRGSVAAYPSDIDDCAFMTHEILHIFGLMDEYGKDSDMKSIPYPIPDSLNPSADNILLYKIRGISEEHSTNNEEYDDCGDGQAMQYNSIMANVFDRWDNVFKFKRDRSLLDATHFNAILYGNCVDKEDVRLYSQCYGSQIPISSYATVVNKEEICSVRKRKSEECRSSNVLGRSRERELSIIRNELSTNQAGYRRKLNWTKAKTRKPVIIEESVYHPTRQYLLERLEHIRNWPDDTQN